MPLRDIAALVEGGAIRPVVDREFAFEQLPDKVVLKVR
jgi:alcohol dehydrogenase